MLLLSALVGATMPWTAVSAHDHGPQVLACDYKLGRSEGTGKCVIHGSGTNQGVTWLVFEVQGKRFRYADSSPNIIERVNRSNRTLSRHAVTQAESVCRPGAKPADVYTFGNGDRVCLYWPGP
ncbi:MAG: hypothetical protein JNJ71_12685 [Rubrivivax sp.]|nr:hypothetical protein [Rubrivivax sp.]